jgi:GMP synthase-like glutamine amidotransferase
MSVNDDLPWIPDVLALVRGAVAADVPVLGHCLGSQLMARALGGVVSHNPVKEIGWGDVEVVDSEIARHWFGDLRGFESFHWHGETFTIPPGATRLAASAHCANQAFALGRHFAMQCHVEMTPALIADWVRSGAAEIAQSQDSPGVQAPEEIERDVARRTAALHTVADRIYDRWTEGLPRG